jgi:type II secretory pathway pseudopilin PulG
MHKGAKQGGLTYLALLFVVAVMGATLALGGVVWQTAQQREKELELLFVGHQFRQAIASYYHASPGGVQRYPLELADLMKDPRFPGVRRHLRRVYADPMTGKTDWGVLRSFDGGIIGVHSLSEQAPIRAHFPVGPDREFTGKTRYADWKFVYLPSVSPAQPPTTPPAQGRSRS